LVFEKKVEMFVGHPSIRKLGLQHW